jgi:hypothetical protein
MTPRERRRQDRLATGKLTSKERRIVEFVISRSHPVTQQEISAFMQASVLDTQSTYYEVCKSLCSAGFLGRFLQDGIWHYVAPEFQLSQFDAIRKTELSA